MLRAKGLCEINQTVNINIKFLNDDFKFTQNRYFIGRLGLVNVINEVITYINQQELRFSSLDHFVTTNDFLYGNVGALPSNANDHLFVYTTRQKPKTKHERSKFDG